MLLRDEETELAEVVLSHNEARGVLVVRLEDDVDAKEVAVVFSTLSLGTSSETELYMKLDATQSTTASTSKSVDI